MWAFYPFLKIENWLTVNKLIRSNWTGKDRKADLKRRLLFWVGNFWYMPITKSLCQKINTAISELKF